jgi:sugar phosphate isomerase/epimerase
MKKITITFCLLFALWHLNGFSQTGRPLFTGKIGVQIYTYRNSFGKGIAAVLDTIKSLGIKEIEGPNPKTISAEEFKKMLDDRGLTMPSIGVDYNLLLKDPLKYVEQAKTLGAHNVMVAWIPHGNTFTLDDAKKAVADFNQVGKILFDNGITFCYHDHGYEFVPYADGTLFDYIVQKTNPKYVSFEMDMMWTFHGGQDPAKLLFKYENRWKMVHLKDIRKGIDNDLTGGTDTKNDVALGTGQLNIPEIMKAALAIGLRHYFIEDESPSHAAQIPVTIAYLRSLTE